MPAGGAQAVTAKSGAQPGNRQDPVRAYNFRLAIQGVVQGHFTRVDGLGVKITPILYREAGLNSAVRAIPGRVEYGPLTLSYGLSTSTELINWLYAAVGGKVDRRNVSLSMLDDASVTEVRRWDLLQAWPCQWAGALLDSMGQELAIESLSLAYDRLVLHRDAPAGN
ncbi:MAG: phage tail protein [Microlunatus sp.]|nr:phage tail protein [Microlunatus sp.]